MLKRWAVMSLVMLLVLGSMGAALAEEGDVEAVEGTEPLDEGFVVVNWVDDLLKVVLYWGFLSDEEPEDCDATGGTPPSVFLPPGTSTDDSVECVPLEVKTHDGRVNHGSVVSAFVHWLKTEEFADLASELPKMPKGQLVKQVAKKDKNPDGDGDGTALELEEDDDDDGGPPAWVVEKKANKVKGKKK